MGWLDALSVSTKMVYVWHQWERPVLYYVGLCGPAGVFVVVLSLGLLGVPVFTVCYLVYSLLTLVVTMACHFAA